MSRISTAFPELQAWRNQLPKIQNCISPENTTPTQWDGTPQQPTDTYRGSSSYTIQDWNDMRSGGWGGIFYSRKSINRPVQ